MMKTIFSDGKTLEIERMLNITVFLPQICYFCGEEIITFEPHKSKSLAFHSLDGNHDNWEPSNKRPAHHGCHQSFHHKGKSISEEHKQKISKALTGIVRSPETRQKMREARLGKTYEQIYGEEKARELRVLNSERMMGDKNPMKRLEVRAKFMGDKNPMKNPETAAKVSNALTGKPQPWNRGDKNVMCRPEQRQRMRDENPMYDPEIAKKPWETRRAKYGPTGMKPKNQAVV